MADEIELKLLVSPEAGKLIPACLTEQLQVTYTHESCQLYNSYYDTPEQYLRKHGMACRVRGKDGVFEQTIKTKGKVIGGLHQRPEYNVAIADNSPNLSLFTDFVWPAEQSVTELQDQLVCLFDTTFERDVYTFHYGNSEIELVFDSGAIETAKEQAPICEIELELMSGRAGDLLDLAQQLLKCVNFRLGEQSKAQRGYRLVEGSPMARLVLEERVVKQGDGSVEQLLCECLQSALGYWQHCEQVLIEEQKLREVYAIAKTMEFLQFVLQQFGTTLNCPSLLRASEQFSMLAQQWQWSEQVDALRELRSKRGAFRKKLAANELLLRELKTALAGLMDQHQPEQLVQEHHYVSAQLLILELLVKKPWQQSQAGDTGVYQQAFTEYARGWVNDIAQQAKSALLIDTELSHSHYLQQADVLEQMHFLDLFLHDDIMQSVKLDDLNWRNILDGVAELSTLQVLEEHLNHSQLEERDALLRWCHKKQRNMVQLMDQETQYW